MSYEIGDQIKKLKHVWMFIHPCVVLKNMKSFGFTKFLLKKYIRVYICQIYEKNTSPSKMNVHNVKFVFQYRKSHYYYYNHKAHFLLIVQTRLRFYIFFKMICKI